jgi:hypothetical protein
LYQYWKQWLGMRRVSDPAPATPPITRCDPAGYPDADAQTDHRRHKDAGPMQRCNKWIATFSPLFNPNAILQGRQ